MNARIPLKRLQKMNRKYGMLIIGVGIWLICLPPNIVNAGILVYWAFDEGNGNGVGDSSSNNHDGTIHGAEWTSPGHDDKGYCLNFDGSGDYVINDSAGKYLNGLDGLTISIWIKSDEIGTDKGFVYCEDPAGSDNRGMRYDAAGVTGNNTNLIKISVTSNANSGTMRGRQQLESSRGVQTTEWQHIAMTWTHGEQLKLYINGKLDSPMANSLGLPGTLEGYVKLIIGKGGKDTDRSSWDGLIDDVVVFDYALDEGEIFHVYQGGSALFSDPILLSLSNSLREAKRILREQNPQKVITLIEKTITQYEQWRDKNPNDVKSVHKTLISDLYYLLARAREAADVPIQDIIETYKQSISQIKFRPNYVPALLWLFKHMPASDYINIIRGSIDNNDISGNLDEIAEDFESSGNWVAFKFFLDAVFSEVNDSTLLAQDIAAGLMEDGSWSDNFLRYANNNPKLQQYYFKNSEQLAMEKMIQNDFYGAADLYRDIVSQCSSERGDLIYKLKIYECILNQGKYDTAISELSDYIRKYNSIDNSLIAKAIVLKGQAYIQLNEIERACDAFSLIIKEYPGTEWTPEAVFFVGYCYMLQGKHVQAQKTFNIVIDRYSYSPYARKASLCLAKIIKNI
jgi:tetratricopeptide (TPR) repeat protein